MGSSCSILVRVELLQTQIKYEKGLLRSCNRPFTLFLSLVSLFGFFPNRSYFLIGASVSPVNQQLLLKPNAANEGIFEVVINNCS